MRISIPRSFKNKKAEYNGVTLLDGLYLLIFGLVNVVWIGLVTIPLSYWFGIGVISLNIILTLICFIKINSRLRIYNLIFHWIVHTFSKKKIKQKEINLSLNSLLKTNKNEITYKHGKKTTIFRIQGFNPFPLSNDEQNYEMNQIWNLFASLVAFNIYKMNGKNEIKEKIIFLNSLKNQRNKKHICNEIEFLKQNEVDENFNSTKWFIEISNDYIHFLNIHKSKLFFIEPSDKEMKNLSKELICDNKEIKIKSKFISLDDKKYVSFVEIIDLPKEVEIGFFSFLNQYTGVKYKLVQNKEDPEKTRKKLDTYILDLKSQLFGKKKESESVVIEKQIQDTMNLIESIQNGNAEIRSTKFIIKIESESLIDLNKQLKAIKEELGKARVNYDFNKYRQHFMLKVWNGLTELHKKDYSIQTTLKAFVIIFPFLETNHNDEKGLYIGHTFNNNDIFFDQFQIDKQRTNLNALVLGTSGSGKSTFTKKLIKNNFISNKKIMIIDPEREYKKICESFNGNWINFSTEESINKINPLQIFPNTTEASHILFLENWFKIIFDLDKIEVPLLKTCIQKLYKTKKKEHLLTDLYKVIELKIKATTAKEFKRSIFEKLLIIFEPFNDKNSPESILWNHKTNIKMDNEFTVFDIQTLKATGNERIVKAQMLIILQLMQSEMIENKVFNEKNKTSKELLFAIDEAHLLVESKNTIGVDFLYQLTKRARKYKTGTIIITQNLKDFIGGSNEINQKTSAIINNAQYQFFFKLKEGDIKDLDNLLAATGKGLTINEKQSLPYAERGECIFASSGQERKQIQIEVTDYEHQLGIWNRGE